MKKIISAQCKSDTLGEVKMKRILLLASICLLLFSSVCFAEYKPDLNRWGWITSNAKHGDFYDKQTIVVDKANNKLKFWLLSVYPENSTHAYYLTVIDYTNRTTTFINGMVYEDGTNKLVKNLAGAPFIGKSIPIRPEGSAEKWADALKTYMTK